jgi:predicted Zn-dependent protease with MMP-like domain
MAAALELVDTSDNPEDIAKLMEKIAFLIEDLSAEEVISDINEIGSFQDFLI